MQTRAGTAYSLPASQPCVGFGELMPALAVRLRPPIPSRGFSGQGVRCSAFRRGVSHIVGSTTEEEMAGPDTFAVIASVQDTDALWNRPIVQFPANTVSECPLRMPVRSTERPIAQMQPSGIQQPASVKLRKMRRDRAVPV